MTIYKATNTINGKAYIGFTHRKFEERKYHHKYSAFVSERNTVFHKALRKHGWESFSWEILSEEKDKNRETYFIKTHNTHYIDGSGYNMTYGGEGELGNKSMSGKRHTQKAKDAVSKKNKGKSAWNRTPHWLIHEDGTKHYLETLYDLPKYGLKYNTLRAYKRKGKSFQGWKIIPCTKL